MTPGSAALAFAATLPWLLPLAVLVWRVRDSRSLDEAPAEPPPDPPLVSVVVPARNERRNIERCVRSALASRWPALEVLVADDQSTDGTGELARALARADGRVRVLTTPDLPPGWFGKPWACHTGARAAGGEVLCFIDADTVLAPDLVPRAVNAMRQRGADAITVAARQLMGSFWERVIQPQVFLMLLARFGGTESVNRSPRVRDKIANGQCILTRRAAYEAVGGHAAVRDKVAEDLMLAQRYFAAGRRMDIVLGTEQLATRMYTSLRELVEGWSKNIFVGGRASAPFGRVGQALYPAMLVLPIVVGLAPPAALLATIASGGGGPVLLWSGVVTAASLGFWAAAYRQFGESPAYAALYPLGGVMLLYITLRAIARGRRVTWKGREYRAA